MKRMEASLEGRTYERGTLNIILKLSIFDCGLPPHTAVRLCLTGDFHPPHLS